MKDVTRFEICLRAGDYTSEYHQHSECEISFILRGQKGMYIKDHFIMLETGSLLFLNRNIEHRTPAVSTGQYEYFVMGVHPELTAGWQHMLPDTDFTRLFMYDYMLLEPQMMDQVFIQGVIKTLQQSNTANMRSVFELKLIELMVYLVIKTSVVSVGCVTKKKSVKRRRYEEIIEYIARRKYSVTLDELCCQFYLNRYYLCHLFKEEGGMTVQEYIFTNKIKTAIKLLEETELPVTKIVEESGFSSISQFGRVFKKITTISPREYRKRFKSRQQSG